MNAQKPTVAVSDVTVDERAGTATFIVTRSGNMSQKFNVDYATADGTAMAGFDYTASSGTLKFAARETTKTVTVSIMDDASYEGDETFYFNLSNPTGPTGIADSQGEARIRDDDPRPPIVHQDDNLTATTTYMDGTDGVQDFFVFNSDYNKNYAVFSDDFAGIFNFKRGEDKIVIIDSDGVFASNEIYHTENEHCLSDGSDCPLEDSYFQFVEAGSSDFSGGSSAGSSKVWGFVDNSLIGSDDIFVTTNLNYLGLTWA